MNELSKIKSEYSTEIAKLYVGTNDLMSKKISEKALKFELYLQKIYGDEFLKKQSNNLTLNADNKSVGKISLDDISFNDGLKEVCDIIDNSKFDAELENLLR